MLDGGTNGMVRYRIHKYVLANVIPALPLPRQWHTVPKQWPKCEYKSWNVLYGTCIYLSIRQMKKMYPIHHTPYTMPNMLDVASMPTSCTLYTGKKPGTLNSNPKWNTKSKIVENYITNIISHRYIKYLISFSFNHEAELNGVAECVCHHVYQQKQPTTYPTMCLAPSTNEYFLAQSTNLDMFRMEMDFPHGKWHRAQAQVYN